MYINLLTRDISDNVRSTADSFKTWDTCMNNKTCKIVAIVGIVLAGLVALWIITTLVQCLCMGKMCLESLCCCCCGGGRRQQTVYQEKQSAYNNPNMYQPVSAPMRYGPLHPPRGEYNNEDPFNENNHGYDNRYDQRQSYNRY